MERPLAIVMNAFRTVFNTSRVVLPVIHAATVDQVLRNAGIARRAGADGVFLINHAISGAELLTIHAAVREAFPGWWIGVNRLGVGPVNLFQGLPGGVTGVWADNARIQERQDAQPEADLILHARATSGWQGLFFGGVAFKYQRHVDDLQAAARIARNYMDVVTTSGPGTGQPAHVEKIRVMKQALGDFPLAIASGITPENVLDYLPWADCFLVATGISRDIEELDPDRVDILVQKVRSHE